MAPLRVAPRTRYWLMDPSNLIWVVCPALWAGALLTRDRGRVHPVAATRLKFTHALPSTLQLVLFTYWSRYEPAVIEHAPLVAAQIALAYCVEYLLAWSLRRPFVLGLGPLPIVLSANLFVWFPGRFALHGVVTTLAIASKTLLIRGGRHIFNPSVFGLSIVGILTFVAPHEFTYRDLAHSFASPPNMALLILALAAIPQTRLGTTPLTIGSAATILLLMVTISLTLGYRGAPSPWWPPWLLTMTLLAADPMTIPTTAPGRLLAGSLLGVLFYVVSRTLLFAIETDTFSKIIPIAAMNLVVPQLDSLGLRLARRAPWTLRLSQRRYVALWVAASAVMISIAS